MHQELFSQIDTYIADLFVPTDAALDEALRTSEQAGLPGIQVSPVQGKLLYMLALLSRAHNILEIGTLGGYSTIWMARALPENGRLISLEYNANHADVARANIARAGLAQKVEIRVGHALDLLPQLASEQGVPFDMIFIDADKEPYSDYFHWSLRLARPGTLIIADNVIRKGAVLETAETDASLAGIQQFNAAVAAEPRVEGLILPMVGNKGYDGIALAVVKDTEEAE